MINEPTNNPLNNNEEHEKLVSELKNDTNQALQAVEKWKGSYVKSEQRVLELERVNRELQNDKEDLRRQIQAQRRIELDKKETREGNQFLDILNQKLDQQIIQQKK